jgi:glycerol kinase
MLARTTRPWHELAFGTVDSWLLWKLSGGRLHLTDPTNASRTMLFGLEKLDWDDELLALFGVPRELLPRIVPSSGVLGEAELFGVTLPICGVAGDQQAALFGQGCVEPGQAKATYGTGSFVLVNCGGALKSTPAGLLQTPAAVAPGFDAQYALEGAILVSGAAIQWLRDGLGLIATADECERLALEVDSTGGVHFVPALAGLGAPHWDADARGLIAGLTRGTTKAQLVRAALEAIAFQVADVLDALPGELAALRADGGATANRFLMQFQADLLACPVEVAAEAEMTALGAAALAGLADGTFESLEELTRRRRPASRFEPRMAPAEIAERREAWRLAVRRTLLG